MTELEVLLVTAMVVIDRQPCDRLVGILWLDEGNTDPLG